MALNPVTPGEGYTSAYIISASPFVTSSKVNLGEIREVVFDHVTRFFSVKNTGDAGNVLAVGFTLAGMSSAASNFFVVSGSQTFSGDFRTDRLFLSGASGAVVPFTLAAGLTFIPSKMLTPITGSNGFSGVG